jgi:hypothetical protein
MKIERIHLLIGLVWLLLGMMLGEHMGRTGDHGQMPTHAHIMLVGGVLSVLWAVLYRVFALGGGLIPMAQTALHHLGAMGMIGALFMLYGEMMPEPSLGPILGVSAGLIMLSVVLMLVQVLRAKD